MTSAKTGADDGELLVTAMTRPFTVGGFTLSAIAITIFIPLITAAVLRWIWALLLIVPLFVVCYLVCAEDVHLFDVARAMRGLKACRNRRIWGCRRYAAR